MKSKFIVMINTLFVNWNVDPEIFSLGALSVRWYGLLFISGFILGWFIFKWFFKREGVPEALLDPLLYTRTFSGRVKWD